MPAHRTAGVQLTISIMNTKFFLCPICGNLILKVEDGNVTPVCCDETMTELIPNTIDASQEHHVPAFHHTDHGTLVVEIGAKPHPATEAHHICFIYLETTDGCQLRYLKPTAPARAEFYGCTGKVTAIYAYCNLHGLWKLPVTQSDDCAKSSCASELSCATGSSCATDASRKGRSCFTVCRTK